MLKRFIEGPTSTGKDVPKTSIIVAHAGRDIPILPVSSGGLPQMPESPKTPFTTDLKPVSSLDSVSSTHSEGHILAGRGPRGSFNSPASETFEEVSLNTSQNGVLNGKLVQVLERRKAKEAEASKKLEAEHAAAMQRKDKFHMEQLELMDAAHHRTVSHMELEMDKLRSQLTTALTRWEAAEEEGLSLKSQLEAEKKLRLKAEREQEELSSLLEAELQFD